jgi:glycosyltransferase involved in cell wall biosynthesis
LGIMPHVLYFKAGEKYDLDSNSPVFELAASVTCGGSRRERPDKNVLATIRRKFRYLTLTRKNALSDVTKPDFPFSYQYDYMDAGLIILNHAMKIGAKAVILRNFLCHWIPALHRAGIKIIVNCPDYNTKLAREMITSVPGPIRKIGPACNYLGVRTQERAFMPHADEVWVATREEIEEMSCFIPEGKLLLVPNLVDVLNYPDFSGEKIEPHSLLFIGNYNYAPNANAAKTLLVEIFNHVKQRFPNARLYLVGKGLPEPLNDLAGATPGIIAPGFVKDPMEYFKKASLFICPVKEGAGALYKVLEAMATGKPVVGLKKSYRSIADADGVAYFSTNSVTECIERVYDLLRSAEKRITMARSAGSFAEHHFLFERGHEMLSRLLKKSLI